jgi:prephenate dehydrogenase
LSQALILGTGLIGASVGAGLTGRGWHVAGWDPDRAALAEALEMGAVSEVVSDPFGAAGEVDLVVLCGPAAAIIETLERLETDALVTDVAGVKVPVVRAARHLARFVGGHPMAGRESSGPGSASAAMFRGAAWILTEDGAAETDLKVMEETVEELGAFPVRMSAEAHDAAVAAVSHLPQVVASALVDLVASDSTAFSLAAGGFRDVTRIALSEPGWWTDILTENRQPLSELLRRLSAELEEWAERVEAADRMAVAERLESARRARKGLAPPVAAVRVLLEDRPGEIARVGHALAEAEVDVRDLQLRHATRGGGGVLTLSVTPGQEVRLAEALRAEGFRLVD